MADAIQQPRGIATLRTVAMPKDTNPSGDIFGGWLMSQMDIAGGIISRQRARGRTATVAVESMVFLRPVHVGDVVCCYGEILCIGRTSITVRIEVWVIRGTSEEEFKVTEGTFTYVAIGPDRRPRPVESPEPGSAPSAA